MIRAVIFDVGGVLAQDVWENLLLDETDGIASGYSLDPTEVERVGNLLWEAFAYRPEDRHNDWRALERQYWNLFIKFFWGREPPANVSIDGFIQMTAGFIRPVDEGMVGLLERLQSRVDLAICSNNNEFWFRRQMDQLQMHRFFSPGKRILSCRVGVAKSSPGFEMFHAAADALGVRRGECVFVDDREGNVARARQCGMKSVQFSSVGHLTSFLKQYE